MSADKTRPGLAISLVVLGTTILGCGPGQSPPGRSTLPLNAGPWYGAELRSRASYGQFGVPIRVGWRFRSAAGPCVVTVFSLFNGARIFATSSGHWSEVALEVFGGSAEHAGSFPAFQSQYITYASPSDVAVIRGAQHMEDHPLSMVQDIWDGSAHDFQVEWRPSEGEDAELIYRLDGQELRRESGGHVSRLEGMLNVYSSVWMVRQNWPWGCRRDLDRPDSATAVLESLTIEEASGLSFTTVAAHKFDVQDEIDQDFERPNAVTWEAFDGSYCADNVVWRGPGEVALQLQKGCG